MFNMLWYVLMCAGLFESVENVTRRSLLINSVTYRSSSEIFTYK